MLHATSILFLSTACSLSIRRRKTYFLANELFAKSRQKHSNIRKLFILQNLIKSLGCRSRPRICLTSTCFFQGVFAIHRSNKIKENKGEKIIFCLTDSTMEEPPE